MTLHWLHPLWLLGLLALPVIGFLLWWRAAAVPLPRAGRMARSGSAASRLLARGPLLLRLGVAALLLLALARPRTPGAVVEEHTSGVPIVVALDLSSSMLAEDFPPRNRLTAAKETLARFIAGRPADPIGIVAFASEALTVSPVTTYHSVLLRALGNLRVGLLADGTAIGDGLAIAANRLRQVPARSRVVILMSDGENNSGTTDPMEAARAAATFGIRVFTIGVGSRGVVRVPVERSAEGLRYARVQVGIDEELLRSIASVTGGQYFRATDPAALERIYARIGELVQTPVQTTRRVLYTEWYAPLLLAAEALLVLEWLLRGTRWGAVPG